MPRISAVAKTAASGRVFEALGGTAGPSFSAISNHSGLLFSVMVNPFVEIKVTSIPVRRL
jgi:hypothetical protein